MKATVFSFHIIDIHENNVTATAIIIVKQPFLSYFSVINQFFPAQK
jgi:hypothetical protein